MSVKFLIIGDLHCADTPVPQLPQRRGDLAETLLYRALFVAKHFDDIDAVLLVGDIINDNLVTQHIQQDKVRRIKKLLDDTGLPYLVVPGNHDYHPVMFNAFFPQPDYLEVKGVRIVPFSDPTVPRYNAERLPEAMLRLAAAREGFKGKIAALQHVPVVVPGSVSPYGYTNCAEVRKVMQETGTTLSISGHYHPGIPVFTEDNITFVTASALCETPFKYQTVTWNDDDSVSCFERQLKLPDDYPYFDIHTHSPYGYCAENMDLAAEYDQLDIWGLEKAAVTEHSRHLWFEPTGSWFKSGMDSKEIFNRFDVYFDSCQKTADRLIPGLEIDCAANGDIILPPQYDAPAQIKIGGLHKLTDTPDQDKCRQEFLYLTRRLAEAGLPVLAHPLRILKKYHCDARPVYRQLVKILKEYNMAAEINCHQDLPEPEFYRLCLDSGVKLVFGSDAHNLRDFGFLQPHIEFLRLIGFNGSLQDILLKVN